MDPFNGLYIYNNLQNYAYEIESLRLLCYNYLYYDETVAHVILSCVNYTDARDTWRVSSMDDLLKRPIAETGFLGEAGWPTGLPARL